MTTLVAAAIIALSAVAQIAAAQTGSAPFCLQTSTGAKCRRRNRRLGPADYASLIVLCHEALAKDVACCAGSSRKRAVDCFALSHKGTHKGRGQRFRRRRLLHLQHKTL